MEEKIILQTPRLILRQFLPTDAAAMYRLNADPEVIRYTGDQPFSSEATALKFLQDYDQYRLNGYGRWAMILKSNHEFIGWCGLRYDSQTNETDLGFRLFTNYWNQGLATEAAKACIDYGFTQLQLKELVGRVMKANTASIRVLEKAGMKFWKEHEFEAHPGLYYRIQAP